MKTAVVGCGAVGSFYGAKLLRAGTPVHFLLRSDFEVVSRDGLTVLSPDGDFHVRPACATDPGDVGECDLVIVGLKTTANDQFQTLLPPLVGQHTMVLTLQNGMGSEAQLAQLFGAEKVLGGLCFVCLNRIRPGVVHHLAHGRVTLGEYQRRALSRTIQLAETFRVAGVPCEVTEDLERAHWEKLVWNIPFNGLGAASAAGYEGVISGVVPPGGLGPCLTTDRLLADTRWRMLVRDLMREVIAAAHRLGFPLDDSLSDLNLARTECMGPYKPSTVLDYERGRPIELETLFIEPLRQAQTAGVATPRLAAMCQVLTELDRRQRS